MRAIPREGAPVELTSRQSDIIKLVRSREPITGEQIAEALGLTRPAIRSDLVLLVMLGLIDAKPKVGYFIGHTKVDHPERSDYRDVAARPVREVMGLPVVLRETEKISDAVVTMFLENVGSLIVTDGAGVLTGIVSRKDLLKVSVGNPLASEARLGMVMTRSPNVVTVTPDDTVLEAMRRMIVHEVDGLPVVQPVGQPDAAGGDGVSGAAAVKVEPVGRITKTTIVRLFFEAIVGDPSW